MEPPDGFWVISLPVLWVVRAVNIRRLNDRNKLAW